MRNVRVVFGVLGLIVGVAAIAAALVGLNQDRDVDDFFVSDADRFERSSYAITSEGIDVLTDVPGRLVDMLADPIDIRVSGSSNAGNDLFIGVATAADVQELLANVAHDEVDAIEFDGSDIDYVHVGGTAAPGAPGGEPIWVASVEGAGIQTLDWSIEQGEWSVVVMNADGSPGIDASLVRGVRLTNFVVVAWVLFGFGVISVLVGGLLAFRMPRRMRGKPADLPAASAQAPATDIDASAPVAPARAEPGSGNRFFEWINRRYVGITMAVFVAAVLLGVIAQAFGSTDEPNSDPTGEIYTTAARAEEVFVGAATGVQGAAFIVEGPDGGDVLNRNGLLEWKTNSDSLRASTRDVRGEPLNSHLAAEFNTDLNIMIDGVYSIADAVDAALPRGLASATDAEVKVALSEVLAADSPTAALRSTLSRETRVSPGTVADREIEVWESPAFQAMVMYDLDTFEITWATYPWEEGIPESTDPEIIEQERQLEAERWLREVQTELRGDQAYYSAIGLAVDFNLEFSEQADEATAFVGYAVMVILLVVGALLRSYWAAMYVAVGLTATGLIYRGIFALLGLKGGMLLGVVVPISIISFGVDFFIHAIGRAREAQVQGQSRERAYPVGMSTVILALTLAAFSSAAAFASNSVSGIEMVVQFGIGAGIAILVAFVVLGMLTPKLLLATEEALGTPPVYRGPRVLTKLGFVFALWISAVMIGTSVPIPLAGVLVLPLFVLLFLYLPFQWTRRQNARAAAKGRDLDERVRGVGHGLHFAGDVVHFMARWRVVTIPVVVVLALLGVWGAFQVKSDFQFTDFMSPDSDVVRSMELQELHYGDLGVGSAYIYVEGDLTDPATLGAMQSAVDEISNSGVGFSRDFDGNVDVIDNAVTVAGFATASSAARADVLAATGVEITDDDADGYPDTAVQIGAVYDVATTDGLRGDSGEIVFPPDAVRRNLYVEGDTQATRLEVVIGSYTDVPLIEASRLALDEAAVNLTAATAGADIDRISVSGEPITFRNTLESFTRSMLLSLPLALLLAFGIAAFVMRSLKYALVSVTPIMLVVAWLYGYMYLVGYTINMVTATIAAISIGIGIDFATHFTVRFREELEGEPSRFPALRRAGEGTGGALVLSALTSIAGFFILGLAPMPIFAVYGILTAVMIALAVLVTLLVLPSLLLFVTKSLQGEEREQLEWERTGGQWVYEPHSRETATREKARTEVTVGSSMD